MSKFLVGAGQRSVAEALYGRREPGLFAGLTGASFLNIIC
jgi:hypothetical protein